jgi:hypothetical protein
MTDSKRSPPTRRLVYMEDHQGFSFTPVVFETDCPWPINELTELSEKAPSAGRLSTSFSDFAKLVRKAGFKCAIVERLDEQSTTPEGLEQVKGTTGNY